MCGACRSRSQRDDSCSVGSADHITHQRAAGPSAEKLEAAAAVSDLMSTEFVTQSLSPRTAHHFAGMRRHLYAVTTVLTSTRVGRRGDTTGLHKMIAAIKG